MRWVYVVAKFVCSIVVLILYPFNLRGTQNIPKEGGAIIVANHSSNWDPILIAMATYRQIHFLAKIELFKNFFLNWLFTEGGVIPVDRDNVSPRTMIDCMKLLKDGSVVGIFPEGTRVKEPGAVPMDGFVLFSLRTKAPIIPVHVAGNIKPWHRIDIIIGEPVYLSQQYPKKPSNEKVSEIAQEIMDKIYNLK